MSCLSCCSSDPSESSEKMQNKIAKRKEMDDLFQIFYDASNNLNTKLKTRMSPDQLEKFTGDPLDIKTTAGKIFFDIIEGRRFAWNNQEGLYFSGDRTSVNVTTQFLNDLAPCFPQSEKYILEKLIAGVVNASCALNVAKADGSDFNKFRKNRLLQG